MKTLNQMVSEYTLQVRQGEIRTACQGILGFIGGLRGSFVRQYPVCFDGRFPMR